MQQFCSIGSSQQQDLSLDEFTGIFKRRIAILKTFRDFPISLTGHNTIKFFDKANTFLNT
jgi:hypothetical protein